VKCSPGRDRFFGENTQQEVRLLVRFRCRRYDAVCAWYQLVTASDPTSAEVTAGSGVGDLSADRFVAFKEAFVQSSAVSVSQLHAIAASTKLLSI